MTDSFGSGTKLTLLSAVCHVRPLMRNTESRQRTGTASLQISCSPGVDSDMSSSPSWETVHWGQQDGPAAKELTSQAHRLSWILKLDAEHTVIINNLFYFFSRCVISAHSEAFEVRQPL